MFSIILGAVVGIVYAMIIDEKLGGASIIAFYLTFLLYFFVALILALILHEVGHLIFGLISGYKFCSFRIGPFMFMKKGGKVHFKLFSLLGTCGQCLMAPPKYSENMPSVIYNLGGVLMNVIVAALCAIPLPFVGNVNVELFFIGMVLVNVLIALLNGVPMRAGYVDNDGKNALSLKKHKSSLRAFYVQLEINRLNTEGYRLNEMPDELFELFPEEEMRNSLTLAVAVFRENRCMQEKDFDGALDLILKYKDNENLVPIYRVLLIADEVFIKLCRGYGRDEIDRLLTDDIKKIMKSAKGTPSFLRTNYVVFDFCGDEKMAKKSRAALKKLEKNYPYSAEIESEFELIDYYLQKEVEEKT
jgi:hypothetical protein